MPSISTTYYPAAASCSSTVSRAGEFVGRKGMGKITPPCNLLKNNKFGACVLDCLCGASAFPHREECGRAFLS